MEFAPRLDILPPAQRRLWDELGALPNHFTLWGGTALALHLGHRPSVDFDFFTDRPTDLAEVERSCPLLRGARVVQREPQALTAIIDRGGPVQLSLFCVPGALRPTRPFHRVDPTGIAVADLIDVAAMKLKVVPERAEIKDYVDIAAVLTRSTITLTRIIQAARAVYGPVFEPLPSLKALTFFDDATLDGLPQDVRRTLVNAVACLDEVMV